MFDLNFISDPGLQENSPSSSWSFLHKRRKRKIIEESNPEKIIQSKSYVKTSVKPSLIIICIILFVISVQINSSNRTVIEPSLVLNQVIDLILESSYLKKIKLQEAEFYEDQAKVIIRASEYSEIQDLIQGYRKEDEIPYIIYNKGGFIYLDLIFPWKTKREVGNVEVLKSMTKKTIFSNKIAIKSSDNIFEIHGRNSDIISFLLEMEENKQLQHFNFSVFPNKLGDFVLKIFI